MAANIKVQDYAEMQKKIQFLTKVSIDENGICRGLCTARNTNAISKSKVVTKIQILNEGRLILEIKTDPVFLYGYIASRFSSSKKSNINQEIYGRIDFNDIDMPDTNKIEKLFIDLDKEIKKVGEELRKTRILNDKDDPDLVDKLNKLKKQRQERWDKEVYKMKFDMFSINVNHVAM